MNPQSQGFSESPRKRCCRQRLLLVLLGMLTTALWAGLLTLLLLWHWDTMRTLRQLEVSAARNVSQVSRDLHRYQSDQMAQKSQAAQLSRNMQELQARQKQMESQDSELSWNLDRLLADLSDTKSQSLNQRRAASDSLEKLQEEVEKLWMQILVSKGSACNTCPERWLHFQQKCYYFGKGAKRWVQARFTCSDLEGRLVSVHSQEEQDFLTKHADKRGSWIGLRDLDLEGEFIWMDGSPVGYSNWNPREPNNQDQGEDCVMMRGSGKWNDASCRSQLDAWVCERLATCGPPAPSASGDLSEPAPPLGSERPLPNSLGPPH
uniref:Fc epsilon receptor II n=1 Tax=Sciurus vulgaris TaxID=55149 RepID=A0A8D2E091_SCIVU